MIIVWNPPGGGSGTGSSSVVLTTGAVNVSIDSTLSAIRSQVLYWLDEAGDTGTTQINVNYAINQAHMQRVTAMPWSFMLWDTPETFSTSADVQLYPLHQEFFRPFYFFNRTKTKYMREMNARELGPSGIRWNTDTQGDNFALWARTAVKYQPSSSSLLSLVSSDATDNTSAKAVIVRGVTANGTTNEVITPAGITPVSSTLAFSKILNVTKSTTWAGTLTMTSNSAAITNLTLFPTELGRSHQQLYMLSNPGGSDVIEYRFYKLPSPLVYDNDVPDIPPPHSMILVWDALLLLAAYNGQLDRQRVAVWAKQQGDIERSMQQTYLEGQSIESSGRYVRDLEDDGNAFIRVNN